MRTQMLKKNKGTDETEKTVLQGLRWLVANQNPDGSWSKENPASMTGLALLAFVGHGEDQTSHEFGPTVRKAVDWLLASGSKYDGRLSLTENGWGGNKGVYEHAIATYALADYFAFTKDARVEPLLRKAVTYIVQGQAPDGGWQYGYARLPNSDTSVSGWQMQALKAAHMTGLAINGVDEALDAALFNLKRVQSADGNFHYRQRGDRSQAASLTGVGLLCSYMWAPDKSAALRKAMSFLLDSQPARLNYKSDSADLYAWYYNTQACVLWGGPSWEKWNRLLRDELVRNQEANGSWPAVMTKAPGGELQRQGGIDGAVYRTSLCVLMLESYYRNF
jgi:hypothetical protein